MKTHINITRTPMLQKIGQEPLGHSNKKNVANTNTLIKKALMEGIYTQILMINYHSIAYHSWSPRLNMLPVTLQNVKNYRQSAGQSVVASHVPYQTKLAITAQAIHTHTHTHTPLLNSGWVIETMYSRTTCEVNIISNSCYK